MLEKNERFDLLGLSFLNTECMHFFNDINFINIKIVCCLPAAAHKHRSDPSEQREGATSSLYPHQWPVEEEKTNHFKNVLGPSDSII